MSRKSRIRIHLRLLTCAILAAYLLACEISTDTSEIPVDQSFVSWLDGQMPNLLANSDVPGAAVAVMENGQISLSRGYGHANTEDRVLMTENHIFNVASISKLVTAWGVMQLAEQGRFDLDQPVNAYLERWQLADRGRQVEGVTVRQLLSHTGGVSMPSTPGFRWPMTVPGLVDILSGHYTDSTYAKGGTKVEVVVAPGQEFRYSGGGYLVLQLLVEEVTGQTFQDYMREEVLIPLGMTNSQFGWDPTLTQHMATPYLASGYAEDIFRLPGYAASSLHTSANDLAKWMMASAMNNRELRNQVISDRAFELMIHPVTETHLGDEELEYMGLGYFLEKTNKALVAGHSGGNAGWRARVLLTPGKGHGMLVLTNSDNGGDLVNLLSRLWLKHQDLER